MKKVLSAILLAAIMVIGTIGISTSQGQEIEDSTQSASLGTEIETEAVAADATEAETETEADIAEANNYPEIISDEKVDNYQSVVAVGDSAYELYTYLDDVANNYAKSVNSVAKSLDGIADVYDIVVPLSSGITFPDNLRDKITSSDQQAAVKAIEGKMDSSVHVVNIYDTLMQHRNEYIYFRTDHHWTTLGAYYAYTRLCEEKGIEPEGLESHETIEFDGFLGSFYNDTSDAKLKANPDTVTAYYPTASSTMHVEASDGTKYDWPVIYDVTNYSASLKYSTFIASDNPYTEIVNGDLDDGSSCIVVKESFGNAFVPFLVDHYQTIYVIDYRYWTGSISELAKEKGVSDVIFVNNLSMIRNKSLVGKLYRVK
jgi:hypothetical protein